MKLFDAMRRSAISLHVILRNTDAYVAKYVPVGHRIANSNEIQARRIARELKIPTDAAIRTAAPEMGTLIADPCCLVPVPASNCRVAAILALARAIAGFVVGARVICAVRRAHPVESSRTRCMRGLSRLSLEEHAIIRTGAPIRLFPVYFV